MLDPTGDTKRINYSRQDDSARRLWNTKIGEVNPWEHRGKALEDDRPEAPVPDAAEVAAGEAPPTLIEQHDQLALHRPPKTADNPFESLIEHRLHLKLPKP